MIKLAQNNTGAQASSVLTIQSLGSVPSIVVTAEYARKQVNGKWEEDQSKATQTVAFLDVDGAMQLTGKCDGDQAVDVGTVFKVVVEVGLSRGLTSAYEKGDRSRAFTQLEVRRVLEVWSDPKTCLWRSPAAVLDQSTAASGRVVELGRDKAAIKAS